jgi:CheY-like chemotaxis protein
MLYRSTHRLSRAGAPVENLAHSASFHSLEKIAPSNPGIKHLGVAAHAAYDGQSGIAAMDELKPDVVFIDIDMPGIDGYETARRIRQGSHVHRFILVALTGWGRDEDRLRAQQAGFDLHLTKPAAIEEIKALLGRSR